MRDIPLNILKGVYWFGIVFAGLMAATGNPAFRSSVLHIGDLSGYLLRFGVIHMLMLVSLGFLVARPNKPVAGGKIQTAGYLHTLIGFAAALLLIDSPTFSLPSLISPLGSAVFTSIIGWFAGGEIAERGSSRRESFIDTKMDAVAKEFEDFAVGVRRIHEKYITTLRETIGELERETDALRKAKITTTDLSEILDPVARLSETLLKNLRELAAKSQEAKEGLADTASAARDTAKYLKESKVLIDQLENLLDSISKSGRSHHDA